MTTENNGDDRIKVALDLSGTTVIMNVMYVDPRFIATSDRDHKEYKCKNGFTVSSFSKPELCLDEVFLWGDQPLFNKNFAIFEFDTAAEAIEYIKKVEEALADWAANAPEFQVKKEQPVKETPTKTLKKKKSLDFTF